MLIIPSHRGNGGIRLISMIFVGQLSDMNNNRLKVRLQHISNY